MSAVCPDSPATPSQSGRIRAIAAGSAGNLIEWYDFYTYAFMALYFAPAFFPKGDRTAQLLDAAGIYAVGFLIVDPLMPSIAYIDRNPRASRSPGRRPCSRGYR